MRSAVELEIQGLGVIFYSPFGVRHIAEGQDYLEQRFTRPEDVAAHVMACELSGFCTGSPGKFRINLYDGPLDVSAFERAHAAVRLGIEIRDRTLCFRDLYDLMEWSAACPKAQQVPMEDGLYRITAYTKLPPSGELGDNQDIWLHFEPCAEKPALRWGGVPNLAGSDGM